ncbi:MAG: L-rhamnose mutarotase [Xanthomonadaceae bacterium]|nr:L-rhamnose mutarotase [Xanthomonadaceae bacterium]MDE2054721.1 L-rhamnose mutarotase [Xanthomonadaceae bacterium]MDE2226106.1 L-rhamnose mutarotase [Xanthomonadaceae bacterium]
MRLCYALDLKDDPVLIAEYERWHAPGNVPREIVDSIRTAGIRDMEIFRAGNRLFMVIEADEDFSPAAKVAADATNPRVRAWETLMHQFQQPLPFAKPGEKWVAMRRMFSLEEALANRRD